MRVKSQVLAGALLLVAARPASGVVGCLTPETDLAKRADVVVAARILDLAKVTLSPCPPGIPEPYRKCGDVTKLRLKVLAPLCGSVPSELSVHVAPESIFSLSCDDRPPVAQMPGLDAVFFLESQPGQLWTLDGPNSIYTIGPGISKKGAERLKERFKQPGSCKQ
jgi:hypothetical protein